MGHGEVVRRERAHVDNYHGGRGRNGPHAEGPPRVTGPFPLGLEVIGGA